MKKIFLLITLITLSIAGFSQHQYTKQVTVSGTDTYTTTITTPSPPVNYDRLVINGVKFPNTNTGASTFNVTNITGAGAVAIRYWDGNSWEPLPASHIDVNTVYKLAYNGSFFQLESFGGAGGSGVTSVDANVPTGLLTVSGVPITTSGTIDIGLETQNVNEVFAGPASGGAATPAFRALVVDDIPDLSSLYAPVGASGLTIGTSTITSGTNTRVLYNNAGTLGEYTVSGSGNVAMTTSPVFTTPNIGSATGSISGNAGTATALQTARTINGTSFDGTGNITVTAAAGTLTGGTLAAGVTASSLTSFGSSPTIVTPSITTGFTIGGSAASGTIMRGNGTNYISSTATYPNTVTAPAIMVGNSSNAFTALSGTANQFFKVNSGGTAIEAVSSTTGSAVTVTSGSNLHFTTGGNISTGAVNPFSIGGNYGVSTSVTTTATLSGAYEVVHATSSGGSYTITLPPLATYTDKIYMIIKETAANTITIDGDGSETVAGATTFAMTDLNQTLIIQAQAGGWMPINLNYSGTYTPTLTNSANLSASTARLCTFNRVGNSVTVSGQVDIDPTTTATLTTLGISLPVASNFTTAFQAGGSGAAIGVADAAAGIQSDATNDRATFQYVCTDVTNHTMTFTFTYQIL